jgi:alpha-L-rhamnosidase
MWIGMLHDFLVYRGDTAFLAPYVPFAREVLAWFERRMRPDRMLGRIAYAPFVDWAPAFECGNAPQDEDGGSSILTLLFARACLWQEALERHAGERKLVSRWRKLARRLGKAVRDRTWTKDRGLVADTSSRGTFSVHAQVEAVLAGALRGGTAKAALRRALDDPAVTQPGTHYYRYHVMRALQAAGVAERFHDLLGAWTRSLEGTGLTTWPETDIPGKSPRSDCHGWSVAPAIGLVEIALGLRPDPARPGFGRVVFDPAPGPLEGVSGELTTPRGAVRARLERALGGKLSAEIESAVPVAVPALRRLLPPGRHSLVLPAALRARPQ